MFLPIAVVVLMTSVSLVPPASAKPRPAVMWSIDINHQATFWGVPMDTNHLTPAWHIRAAIAHLLDKQHFVSTYYSPSVPFNVVVINNPVPAVGYYTAWDFTWTPPDLSNADPFHPGAISLYNNVASAPDYLQARDHLLQAGMGWTDGNNDGVIDNPPASQIDFYVPNTSLTMQQLGSYLATNINLVFGAPVVNLIITDLGTIFTTVWNTVVPDDWHLYAGGWAVDMSPPDYLYALFHSNSITTPTAQNYIFYSNPNFDALIGPTPPNPTTAWSALEIFGDTVGTIPVMSLP